MSRHCVSDHSLNHLLFQIAAVIALVVVMIPPASAQPILARERQLAGAMIGYQGSFYSGNIEVFSGGTQCGVFESGNGWRPIFGALAEFPLSRKVNIAPRIVWDDRSGAFATSHSDNSALIDGKPAPVNLQFILATTLREITLDLPLKWMPFPRNNFYFLSGPSLGYITAAHFHETESVASPSNAYFKDNGRQDRDLGAGDFATVQKIQFGMCLGIGYDFPISREAFIAPEISSVLGFSSALSDHSWTVITVRFSASIKADISGLFRNSQIVEPLEEQQHEQPQQRRLARESSLGLPAPEASVQVMGILPDGDQTPHPILKVEEYLSTDLQPVLNYVFFGENSDVIAPRYIRYTPEQAESFSDTALLSAKTMELYYNTMNLLGRRLRERPNAMLRIVGCNTNEGLEKENTGLSKRRAQAVENYFLNVWKIAPSRLIVSAQNLPSDPSRVGTSFGDEENRRVELWCDDPQVMSPVTLAGMERQATPPKIRMYMHSDNLARIAKWNAEAVENGSVIATIKGDGMIPPTFDWILSSLADSLIHEDQPVHFRLTVTDSAGQSTTTETSIQLRSLTVRTKREHRIADKRIDKFSLFLFDFDQSILSERSEAVMRLVEQAVTPASSVSVIGFCDRTGEAEHNKSLSLARARTVADHIAGATHPAELTSEGRGDTELLFDNALPEGRYFSRTVYVRVETPVEEIKN